MSRRVEDVLGVLLAVDADMPHLDLDRRINRDPASNREQQPGVRKAMRRP